MSKLDHKAVQAVKISLQKMFYPSKALAWSVKYFKLILLLVFMFPWHFYKQPALAIFARHCTQLLHRFLNKKKHYVMDSAKYHLR